MAIPNNYIDKITDHDSGESRPICPPADHVSVDNENYEGETLDEVLDEVAQAIEDAGQGGYAPPAGGIPKTDLAQSVQDSLDKADSALQSETDPTVPSWAKRSNPPTAQDIGAMPAGTFIPDKTSDLDNDSGFITLADVPEGTVVLPATATPQMDGTAAVGSSERYAREDHVHPHDTTKQDVIPNLATIIANAGKGVADVSSPQEDGSFTITLANGDTYTVNLNHQHTQYQPLLTSANAGSNVTITTDQQTGNIIISSTGGSGGGGISGITMNGSAVPVGSNGVVDLGTVITSLAGRVQSQDVASIVKITQADYTILPTKDPNTLYIITES